MACDIERAGELVLALMQLTLHDHDRVWQGYDWGVMNYLFEQGLITDPVGKAKSVALTDAGIVQSRAMFEKYLESAA